MSAFAWNCNCLDVAWVAVLKKIYLFQECLEIFAIMVIVTLYKKVFHYLDHDTFYEFINITSICIKCYHSTTGNLKINTC